MHEHPAVTGAHKLHAARMPEQRGDRARGAGMLITQLGVLIEDPQRAARGHRERVTALGKGQLLAPLRVTMDLLRCLCTRVPEQHAPVLPRRCPKLATLMPGQRQQALIVGLHVARRLRQGRLHEGQRAVGEPDENAAPIGRPGGIDRILAQRDAAARDEPTRSTHAMQLAIPASSAARSRFRPMKTRRLDRSLAPHGRSSLPSKVICTP